MHIVHENDTSTTLAHGEDIYEADEIGCFEVPDELGAALIRFPLWEQYDGTNGKAAREVADESTGQVPVEPAKQDDQPAELSPLPEDLDGLKGPELAALCKERALDPKGKVDELRERLVEWQKQRLLGLLEQ